MKKPHSLIYQIIVSEMDLLFWKKYTNCALKHDFYQKREAIVF